MEVEQGLAVEVTEIEDTLRQLEQKLEQSEQRQRELQSIRLALEKEISVKKTSISIDRDRCLRERMCFPATNHLSGYRTAPFGIEQT